VSAAKTSREAKTSSKAKTSSEANDDKTSSGAKLSFQADRAAKLAKLVEKAKTTDMWCLSRFLSTTQEAMAKQKKICPINLRGRCARRTTAGKNTPRSATLPPTAKGKS
jgi:hypothetical protein